MARGKTASGAFDSLRRIGALHPCAEGWTPGQKSRLADIASGVLNPTEPDVTRFIAGLDGDLEQLLIEAFCHAGHVRYRSGLRLVSGVEFRRESADADSHRAIDLVIINTAAGRTPVIAIEAKFDAWVNGGFGYCPESPDEYSNQIICYTHGCTNKRLDTSVKYIWLGLGLTADGTPWGNRAITARDGLHLAEALVWQAAARELWHHVEWNRVWSLVAQFSSNVGEHSEALLRALGAGRWSTRARTAA